MDKRKVLFLCTGNSCRSQMAEALVRQGWGESWESYSAGTRPAGYVHPKAIAVLREVGIEWQGCSQHTDAFQQRSFDLVVTVCDSAAEDCPVWLGSGQVVHSSFPDPAAATGSETEIMDQFRQVRDAIRARLPALLA